MRYALNMTAPHFSPVGSILLTTLLVFISFDTSISFQLAMMSKGAAAEVANFAVRQSPASTTFVTNRACPFAQKAWIALEVCRAPFEMKEVSLYGSNGKPDWFLELNPAGTVPVLECFGGAVVYPDSDLILEQICQGAVEGGSVLKADDDEMEKLVQDFRSELAAMLPVGKAVVLGNKGKRDELWEILKRMDRKVVGPWLCGDKVTIADCAVFPFLWRLENEFGLDDCPKLKTWLSTCEKEEAFRKTIQSSWWWWW